MTLAPLPAATEEDYHALPATTCWIDDYVAFARQHVPTTPDNVHEAAAIWMISLAIARRLVLHHAAGDFYIAAQRGWLIDEASFFFDSLARGYMTRLRGYVLDCYDGLDEERRETQSGGRVTVRHVHPTSFSVTIPASMIAHLRNERFWNDGLWRDLCCSLRRTSAVDRGR